MVEAGLVQVTGIFNRSHASAEDAARFIGQGEALQSLDEMPASDVYMIACSDDQIRGCTEMLARTGLVRSGTLVFHCSGAFSSELLSELGALGANTASVHAMKSFPDAMRSCETFPGTFCGIEGDTQCCEFLERILASCGGVCFPLTPDTKILYHAGAVFVCNYLTALVEAGLRCFEGAGLDRAFALRIIEPFIRETVANNITRRTHEALTGPIARGDSALVAQQYEAVNAFSRLLGDVYSTLGRIAVEVSADKGLASAESLAAIGTVLSR